MAGPYKLSESTERRLATVLGLDNAQEVIRFIVDNAIISAGGVPDGDKGDLTVSAGGTLYTIDNSAITTIKLADDSVTVAKLAPGTAGKYLGFDVSGNPTELDAATTTIESPDTQTYTEAVNGQMNFVVDGNPVGNVIYDAGLGMPKWTLSGILDPQALVLTPVTLAQRNALVATLPLTKKGWMVFVVDGATEEHQVFNGATWDTLGSGGSVTTDAVPTDGSVNPVQSNGVFDALALKVDESVLSAKGSLISASAAATPVVVLAGTNGQVLSANSAQASGLEYITIPDEVVENAGALSGAAPSGAQFGVNTSTGALFYVSGGNWTAVPVSTVDLNTTISDETGANGILVTTPASPPGVPDVGDLHIEIYDDVTVYFTAVAANWTTPAIVRVSRDLTPASSTKAWTASTAVVEGELRYFVIGGVRVYVSSATARTTGATANVAELAQWWYNGQSIIPGFFPPATGVLQGFQFRVGDTLWQSPSTRTTGATFDATEQAQWAAVAPGIIDWATGISYEVGMYVNVSNRLYKVAVAHTSAALATTDIASGNLVEVGQSRYRGDYSSTEAYAAHDIVQYGNELYSSNFARVVGVWGASPTEGIGAGQWRKLPGAVRGPFSIANSYAVGDLVWDAGTNIGLVPGIYRTDVAYTAGNAPDYDSFTPIAVQPVFRGDYGLGEYRINDVVVNDNKLYTVTTVNGSNNIGGPFDETKFLPSVFPSAKPWAASVKVGADEVRRTTVGGITTYLRSTAARTTGATFDSTEAAFWGYIGQSLVSSFPASSLVIPGFRISQNGQLWQAVTVRTTGATFDATEQDIWSRPTADSSRVRSVSADYTATDNDDYIVANATAGPITVTIPVTLSSGKRITVHVGDVTGGSVTVASTALVRSDFTLGTSETFATQYTNVCYVNASGAIRIFA